MQTSICLYQLKQDDSFLTQKAIYSLPKKPSASLPGPLVWGYFIPEEVTPINPCIDNILTQIKDSGFAC